MSRKDIKEIKQWLEPTDSDSPASEYRKHLHSHAKRTGEWILETDQYRQWSESNSVGDLWIRGIPGCGKSVVAADLISRLRRENDGIVLFFFREIIQTNKSPRSLVQDFCHGLLDYSPSLASDLLKLKEGNYSTVNAVPFDKLWKCLVSGLISTGRMIYCVADALDEMERGNDKFIQEFLSLGQRHPEKIKIIVTSRQVPHLEKHMSVTYVVDLRLDRRNVDRDISLYLTQRLENCKLDITSEEAEHVKKAICDRGNGLFLYARLMFDQLLLHPREMLSNADNLPDGLGDMYTDILNTHVELSGTTPGFQRLILEWITHSARPMRLLELSVMIDSLPDRGGLNPEADSKSAIKTTCGPLLEVCEDGVVQIIHHSLTEFALNRDVSHTKMAKNKRRFLAMDSPAIHARIASTCLNYLTGEALKGFQASTAINDEGKFDPFFKDKMMQERFLQFYFLQYAIDRWPFHAARAAEQDMIFQNQLIQFFTNGTHAFKVWKQTWCPSDVILYSSNYESISELPPLVIAAYLNLIPLARHLIASGADLNVMSKDHEPPLCYAARYGRHRMVNLLLEHGARHNILKDINRRPVHYATLFNHTECLRSLIDHGAEIKEKARTPSRSRTPSETPMEIACRLGHREAVLLLMQEMDRDELCNGMYNAASNGESEILLALLQNEQVRLDINSKNREGQTPLYMASRRRSLKTIRVLLDHNADISVRAPYRPTDEVRSAFKGPAFSSSYTPIHEWAAGTRSFRNDVLRESDMWGALDLLLEAGCDINARDHLGRTPLFSWGQIEKPLQSWLEDREGNEDYALEFVSSLLERGADPNILDFQGGSVLHMKDRPLTPKILKLFVDAGVDINTVRKKDGMTPLMLAASLKVDPSDWHKYEADFDKQDWKGNTALHHCLQKRGSDSLGFLDAWISQSNLHIQNYLGMTPLHTVLLPSTCHFPFPSFCEDVSLKMVRNGAPLEVRDNEGRTILHIAVSEQRISFKVCLGFIREILERGADPSAKDFKGQSVLHYAFGDKWESGWPSSERHQAIDLLVKAGAEIHAIDIAGNSIFHQLVESSEESTLVETKTEKFLEIGGQVNVSNNKGQNALHIAARREDPLPNLNGRCRSKPEISTRLEYLLGPPFPFDIDSRDHSGSTPLHVAAANSEINTYTLIKAGAMVNAEDHQLSTPLHQAAKNGQSNIVGLFTELYQKQAISINQVDLKGQSALHHASRSGDSESVRLLIQAGGDVTAQDERGRTPLHAAAEFTELQKDKSCSAESDRARIEYCGNETYIRHVIQLLIAAGADPEILDSSRNRPYDAANLRECSAVIDELRNTVIGYQTEQTSSLRQSASTIGEEEMRILVNKLKIPDDYLGLFEEVVATGNDRLAERFTRDHNIKLFDANGKSALHYVARHGLTSVMKCLLPLIDDMAAALPSLLQNAVERSSCNIEMIELLSQKIPEMEEKSSLTRVLGVLAPGTHWWHSHALSLLLKAGVPTQTNNSNDKPPLHTSLESHRLNFWRDQTLDVLLKHGADPDAILHGAYQKGQRPLNFAIASSRDLSVLQSLIDRGASTSYGPESPVYTAISWFHMPALELLLEVGADPNGTEEKHPLIQASLSSKAVGAYSSEAAMNLLLRHGADPSRPVKNGSSTVLHEICAQNDNVQPIVAFGCDLNIRDANGRTPLMRSCMDTDAFQRPKWIKSISATSVLLKSGADAGLIDNDGSTALHHAISSYNLDAVNHVLGHSRDSMSITNAKGYTPLQCALEGYADYVMKTSKDQTHVLGLANTYYKIITKLLEAGANPLDVLPDGRTALHCIGSRIMDFSNEDRKEQIELDDDHDNFGDACILYKIFLDAGCDREARDNKGETPIFHFATGPKSWRGSIHLIIEPRYFAREDIEWMAREHDIHKVNKFGDTLLHAIARREDVCETCEEDYDAKLFQIFVEMGLDPWQENSQGQTPLDIAATNIEKREILALFARDD